MKHFLLLSNSGYLSTEDTSKFHHGRDPRLFIGDKIIYARVGSFLKAVFSSDPLFFSDHLNVIKVKDKSLYFLITAILNSSLINFYINNKYRKRIQDSFPETNIQDINNITIPKNLEDHSELFEKNKCTLCKIAQD